MSIVEILKVIVLGIVEGFTEWLPISSTGHMILVDEIIHLNQPDAFKDMFLVVIQLGAILAVAVMYFQKLNPFSPSKSARQKQATWALWIKIVIACIPAAVLGLLFDDWMEAHLYNAYVVAATLIIYGVLFIVLENSSITANPSITKVGHVSTKTALFIGLFQLLSLVPGTSRSRFYHFRSNGTWLFQRRGSRIFLLLRYSGHVWSKFFKISEVFCKRKCINWSSDLLHHSGNGYCFWRICIFHPVLNGICAQTRL